MALKKLLRVNKRPLLLEKRASSVMIMTTVSFAVFTDVFLYGIIVPVVPYALASRMGVAQDSLQRSISVALFCYAAGLLVSSPLFGYLADVYQRRQRFMMIGLVALLGSSIMLCVARVLWVFVLGRLLQGMSAACVWTVGLALVTDSFEEEKLGMVMGIIGLAMSLGVFLGPLLGGIIYDRAGYYATFAVVFAVIAFDIVLRLIMLEKKDVLKYKADSEKPGETEDIIDAGSSAEGAFQTNTENAVSRDSTQPVKVIKRSGLLPAVRLLSNGRMLNVMFISVIVAWVMTALDSILPLHTETVFHFSSLGSGLIFLPVAITSLIAPAVGLWVDKKGPRWPLTLGLVLTCPFLILLRLPKENDVGQIVLLFAIVSLLGLSLALLLPATMTEISTCVMAAEQNCPGIFGKGGAYGQAFGLFNFAYSAGSLFGPLQAGFVAEAHGWNTVTWTLGLISAFSAIPAVLFTGGFVFAKKKSSLDGDSNDATEEESVGRSESVEAKSVSEGIH
ncbi:major facilitator superfamily domain-containing protein [Lipomyces arxii]|uniref:major facilitator superfamily domain-containing protein n=1 Tax=Lipomyces arxii TaxID=56418 RepID=UPI0034D01112